METFILVNSPVPVNHLCGWTHWTFCNIKFGYETDGGKSIVSVAFETTIMHTLLAETNPIQF